MDLNSDKSVELQLIVRDLWLFFIEQIVNGLRGYFLFSIIYLYMHLMAVRKSGSTRTPVLPSLL